MDKSKIKIFKIIFISTLVSASVIVWYELIGAKFLIILSILCLIIVLTSKAKDV